LIGDWLALLLMFGARIEGFDTPMESLLVTLSMFVGDMGDEVSRALHQERYVATIIFIVTLMFIVIIFLNILIAVLSGAYDQASSKGVYLRYFAKDAYLPSHLLNQSGGFSTLLRGIKANLELGDRTQWNIVSALGRIQFRKFLREENCTVGQVADISRQAALLIQKVRGDVLTGQKGLGQQLERMEENEIQRDHAAYQKEQQQVDKLEVMADAIVEKLGLHSIVDKLDSIEKLADDMRLRLPAK